MLVINGFKRSHFIEGNISDVQYVTPLTESNNTDRNFVHVKKINNHFFSLIFNNKTNKKFTNVEVVDVNSKDDVIFDDRESSEQLLVKKKSKTRLIYSDIDSDSELYTKKSHGPFVDRGKLSSSNIVYQVDLDLNDYPAEYNVSNIVAHGGHICVLENFPFLGSRNDSVNGFIGLKGNSSKASKNAYRENNNIKNYYFKDEASTYSFLDDVDEDYLVNQSKKRLIESFNFTENAQSGEQESSVTYRYKNVHSNKVMYFNFKEVDILPFREKEKNQSEPHINNLDNRYKLLDDEMNAVILENRNINNAIKESIIYTSLGRDIDRSSRSTVESIAFYERLN